MAKSTCFLALFLVAVFYTEAIRIDVAPSSSRAVNLRSITENDPRCKDGDEWKNGIFPNPDDCRKYVKCVNGTGQDRDCPPGFNFDSDVSSCVGPDEPGDCGKNSFSSALKEDYKCPDTDGMFPVKSDPHKYMVCRGGKPTIKECPENQVYSDTNGACVDSNGYPKQSSQEKHEIKCGKYYAQYPNEEDCSSYIVCKDGQKSIQPCESGDEYNFQTIRCVEKCQAYCNITLSCECNWSTCGLDDVCFQEKIIGGCSGRVQRYYFNKRTGQCESFGYSGCRGNDNNFETLEACQSKCSKSGGESLHKKANHYSPDEKNCRKYIKYVNSRPIEKECPPGTAFDPEKNKCTKKQWEKCKDNDILNIVQDA